MPRPDPRLLERGWLHAHEEDTPGLTVFRPDTAALPPSRGRTGYAFGSDGQVTLRGPGPDDRTRTAAGRYTLDAGGRLTVQVPGRADDVMQVQSLDADRLVVKR